MHLEQLAGIRTDPHLLTGPLWRVLVAAHLSGGTSLFGLNLLLLILLAGALAAFVSCGRETGRRAAAIVAALLVIVSPFSLALIRDPLGGEALVTVLLISALAADLAGLFRPHVAVRCALVAALVLQEPSFILAAVAYGLLSLACAPRRTSWLPFAAAALAVVGRLLLGEPDLHAALHPSVDTISGALGAVLLAILLFGVMPIALYLSKAGVYRRLGIGAGWSWPAFILACSAFVGSVFSGTFGLAAHALAAECVLLLPLANVENKGASILNVRSAVLLLVLLLEVFMMRPAMAMLPAVVIERESAGLREALARASADGASVCIVGKDVAHYDLLSGGAFIKMNGRGVAVRSSDGLPGCLAIGESHTRLVSVTDGVVHDWGRSGFAMAKALRGPAGAFIFPVDGGLIEPRRAIHGRDVFSTILETPVGRRPSFTVLAGYSYRFKCVPASAGQMLSFAAANPLANLPGTAPVRFAVIEKDSGKVTVLLNKIITPQPGRSVDWKYYSVNLPTVKGCRDLVFSVSAPTGQAIGTWGTFLGAALTVPAH